jgi:hypothetical protein
VLYLQVGVTWWQPESPQREDIEMIYHWMVTWTERDYSGHGEAQFRTESAARAFAATLDSSIRVTVRSI